MSTLAADIIGLLGSALFIAAFAYANVAKELNKVVFNLANLLGAILLLVSLSVTFNLPAFVLEAVWGTIAAIGLVMALRNSSTRPRAGGDPERPGTACAAPGPPPARGSGRVG